MQHFELNGTIYRITLNKGTSWKDTSADTLKRWSPDAKHWMDSDLSVSYVRSYGTPCKDPS